MKRAGLFVMILAVTMVARAQQPAPPATTQPAPQQPSGAQPAAPQSTDLQPATPPGKKQPQPKTQAELDAYKAALALTDPAAMEKAANDFVVAYPDSDLAPLLYRTVMRSYQAGNNNDKVLEMGQKMLASDPDDPEALVDVAQVMASRTRDTDIDKDQRLATAMKDAQHALETVDTDVPQGMSPAQEGIFKSLMRSNAYGVIGLLHYKAEKFAEASDDFQKSIDAFPQNPDPIIVLRLAFSLDKQGKYADALKAAKQAVELTQDGTNAGMLARQEQNKLTKLAGGGTPAPAAPKN